jgi:hypothetical protein
MCGFRRRKCIGSYLALFAIAFQLFISFGHVHLNGFASTNINITDQSGPSQRQNEPSQNVPDDKYDRCAICAIIGLAGSLLVPDPPIFVPPVTQYCESLSNFNAFHVSIAERVYFQSRAPPPVKSA